jgi:hypothetical protein
LLLLPIAWPLLRPTSPIWPRMRRYAVLGLLGIGCYNALQYLAVKTSTPINVTLVASSTPFFMLGFGSPVLRPPHHRPPGGGRAPVDRGRAGRAVPRRCGAARHVQFVPGDLYMLLAPPRGRSTAGCSPARAIRPRCAPTGPPS